MDGHVEEFVVRGFQFEGVAIGKAIQARWIPNDTANNSTSRDTGRNFPLKKGDINKQVEIESNLLCEQLLALKIYPNGNKPKNRGHISIDFALHNEGSALFSLDRLVEDDNFRAFNWIVSVVDIRGKSFFRQSIGMDLYNGSLKSFFPVTMERFISKDVIQPFRRGFFPKNELKIRCNVFFDFSDLPPKYILQQASLSQSAFREICEQESWFMPDSDGNWLLDLRNPDSPLCSRLRQSSDFFAGLFRSKGKEMADGYMRIQDSEFRAFFNMLCYMRSSSLEHIMYDYEYYALYETANLYGVPCLQLICREYITKYLVCKSAIRTLRLADTFHDSDLRTVAFRFALANWKAVLESEDWTKLTKEQPDLARELSCTERSVRALKDSPANAGLRKLACKQVLLNWKRVRKSLSWSPFAEKLPDLAKVMLCLVRNVDILNLDDSNPVKEYEVFATELDFYR